MFIIKNEEYRHLIKVKVHYANSQWHMKPESRLNGDLVNGKGEFIFRGDENAFARYLMKVKAKDNETSPASSRGKTYLAIAQEIMNGSDPYIYIWNNFWKRSFRPQIENVYKEENIMYRIENPIKETENSLKEKKWETYEFIIPTWAVNAIEYGDLSGLNHTDEKQLDAFLSKLTPGGSWSWGEDNYFSHHPDIGKPTDVVDAKYTVRESSYPKKNTIFIKESIVVEDYILEPGDKIQILKENKEEI